MINFGEGTGVKPPVGLDCLGCEEPIAADDYGVIMPLLGDPERSMAAYHRECEVRAIMGSVGHQMGLCPCYGGTHDDPPGLTPRQAAKAAYELLRKRQC